MEHDQGNDKTAWEREIVGRGEWLLLLVLSAIPGVNLLVNGIVAFRKNEKQSLRNYSFVVFWILVIGYALVVIGSLAQ